MAVIIWFASKSKYGKLQALIFLLSLYCTFKYCIVKEQKGLLRLNKVRYVFSFVTFFGGAEAGFKFRRRLRNTGLMVSESDQTFLHWKFYNLLLLVKDI